jgi:hypothetical protein
VFINWAIVISFQEIIEAKALHHYPQPEGREQKKTALGTHRTEDRPVINAYNAMIYCGIQLTLQALTQRRGDSHRTEERGSRPTITSTQGNRATRSTSTTQQGNHNRHSGRRHAIHPTSRRTTPIKGDKNRRGARTPRQGRHNTRHRRTKKRRREERNRRSHERPPFKKNAETPTQGGSQHDHHEDGPEGETGPPTKRTQAKRGHPAKKEGVHPSPHNKQTDKQA